MNEQEVPAVGQMAPDFSAVDSAGATRTLTELAAGGCFVLVFYRGHW